MVRARAISGSSGTPPRRWTAASSADPGQHRGRRGEAAQGRLVGGGDAAGEGGGHAPGPQPAPRALAAFVTSPALTQRMAPNRPAPALTASAAVTLTPAPASLVK